MLPVGCSFQTGHQSVSRRLPAAQAPRKSLVVSSSHLPPLPLCYHLWTRVNKVPVDIAKQVQEQDVQVDEKGKASLIKGVAKDRRISVEDSEMRHGRKSRSVRVDGYKR